MADESIGDGKKRRPPIESIVPLPLRNWQVIEQSRAVPPVEIDGEATVVDVSSRPPHASTAPMVETLAPDAVAGEPTQQTNDPIDEYIVVTLEQRHQQVAVGEPAVYKLALLNNGPQRALFTVQIAESQPALWLAEPIVGVVMSPGERTIVPVTLTPPKAAISRAGDYPFTFVVTAAEYPGHQSQLTATLTIAPFVEMKLGKIIVPYRTLSWWRRLVTVTVPIINRGNHPTTVFLRAQEGAGACQVTFQARGLRQIRPQQAMVTIAPGRMTPVTLQVYAQTQAWFGRTKRACPLQLTVTPKAASNVEQTALVNLALAPVIGPWQIATLLGLFSLAITGVGLGGLAFLIALIVNLAQPATPVQSLSTVAPPPAIVTVLVQPVAMSPASETAVMHAAAPLVIAPSDTVTEVEPIPPEARNPAVPLVQAEQISAPVAASSTAFSAPTQAVPAGESAAPAAANSTVHTMTYAQMFQEVGLQYDLNWRMLAAQAYVESSFDSLALGSHGDLGLMQIQPPTWREWAPVVAASDPFDSYSNVLVAAAYLDYLRTTLGKQGHPEREWMLVAYNWGPDKVLQHLNNGGSWDDLAPERRDYVEEILRLAETIPPDAAF